MAEEDDDRRAAPRRRKKARRRQQGLGWFVAAVIAALVLLVGGLYAASQGGGGSAAAVNAPAVVKGSLKVDPGQIQMGNIKLGRTVDASFKIQNVGDKPLTITEAPYIEVVTGC